MSRIRSGSTLAGAAIVAVSLACTAASAQPGRGPGGSGWGPGMMMGPGMMGNRGFGFMCNPRAAGFAEWRLQQIEQAVQPNEAQRVALNELKSASATAADLITTGCPATPPAKSTERLAFMETRLAAMQQAVKTVRPAFDAFYAALDDQQKARLDAAGPQRWGWNRWRWHWNDR